MNNHTESTQMDPVFHLLFSAMTKVKPEGSVRSAIAVRMGTIMRSLELEPMSGVLYVNNVAIHPVKSSLRSAWDKVPAAIKQNWNENFPDLVNAIILLVDQTPDPKNN